MADNTNRDAQRGSVQEERAGTPGQAAGRGEQGSKPDFQNRPANSGHDQGQNQGQNQGQRAGQQGQTPRQGQPPSQSPNRDSDAARGNRDPQDAAKGRNATDLDDENSTKTSDGNNTDIGAAGRNAGNSGSKGESSGKK